MKTILTWVSALLISFTMTAQSVSSIETTPQIAINGVGKLNVTPDYAILSFGVESRANDAIQAKRDNDAAVAKVIAFIKKMKIDEKDYQTQRVNLYKSRDYETKTDYFQATQTMTINLKDLTKYEELMMGLMQSGINQIQGIEFKSSKIADYQTEVRTKAIADARKKATDYAQALGQTIGKAIYVSDQNTSVIPMPRNMMKATSADFAQSEDTLAIGEIEISTTVSVRFILN